MFSLRMLLFVTAVLSIVSILRCIWVAVYRLFFHPLATVPGPLVARATHLYAFWHNMHGGSFYLQVQKLHQQYGPVVRITPDEIHLSDPENCEKIYYIGSGYGKDPDFYGAFGTKKATFTTPSPDVHRVKRSALNPFFSRKRVLELEDIVQEKVDTLVKRMKEAFRSTGQIDLHHGFRAISVDVITDYAFDDCYGFLGQKDFGVAFFEMIRGFGPAFWFFQQFPALQELSLSTPFWLAKLISEPLSRMMLHHEGSRRQICKVKDAVDRGEKGSRSTIFHQLLHPEAAEGHVVPTVEELKDEAYIMVAAAADTTGNALTIAIYNVVRSPEIYRQLTEELQQTFPDSEGPIDFVVLEKLPYLTAVIKEALRLSCGVPGRLPRVVPESGAEFNGYYVPAGTVVSMSSWTMHHNEDLFPQSEIFDPNRWMDPATSKTMDKYLFSFGKGSRQCIGMPLAYCELYVTIGRVFRQYDDLKTARKSREELRYNDYFSSYHTKGHTQFIFERAG
ncbi:cytochrome P450 [Aspergillus sclerotioniger CBS 115572]|uniref:Cytochrome P450 n=1 Tax=Aspergillus sclerotioniger CBS 115572 TaxID=1450535 RepID=A0A317X9P2_9EURO|nr:cytochrome P450 [Aspergillus sclerotioniger CBS 115572]PWY94921.1 cytochrome P450 [Aspergillus sclerotioniger CBS 115572]